MRLTAPRWLIVITLLLVLLAAGLLAASQWDRLLSALGSAYALLTQREKAEAFIRAAGVWGPVVFMAIQIFQVVLAPVPGEATGFIGGYLFGAGPGFVYSSIGLALGSWINFRIGRLLGRKVVRRMIPPMRLARMDRLVTHQGVLVLFLLFVFPGFPKDYLCLFLGITALPQRVLLVIATLGRMPGTLMLSLQGAMLYERMYGLFAAILMASLGLALLGYRYRARLYRWMEKINGSNPPSR
jgi:uncharacterized membrane protein YdjX (TVP38/TMEM64 family)